MRRFRGIILAVALSVAMSPPGSPIQRRRPACQRRTA